MSNGFPITKPPVTAADTTKRVRASTGAKNPSGSLKLYFSRIANTHASHVIYAIVPTALMKPRCMRLFMVYN